MILINTVFMLALINPLVNAFDLKNNVGLHGLENSKCEQFVSLSFDTLRGQIKPALSNSLYIEKF